MSNFISTSSTGLSPSMAFRSRKIRFVDLEIYAHHISASLSQRDSVCLMPFSLSANKGIIIYFLFLPVLRCFNSRRDSTQLAPCAFRNLGIKVCMQLPRAYRSLPRLSSKPKPSYPSNSVGNSMFLNTLVSFPLLISLNIKPV